MANINWMRIAPSVAIAGPLTYLLLVLLAVYYYPGYNAETQFLSHLGVEGTSAILFNLATVIAGIVILLLALALSKIWKSLGPYFLIIAGIGMICIAIFPLNYYLPHIIAAALVFLFMPLGLILLGKDIAKKDQKFGFFTIAIGILSLSYLIFPENPILQKIVVFLFLLWSLSTGAYLSNK